jgi:hypothetical protein
MVEQADVCRVRYVSDGGIVARMASTELNVQAVQATVQAMKMIHL